MDRQESQPRQRVSIVDANFAHAPSSSYYNEPRYFTWDRTTDHAVCFITDRWLTMTDKIPARRKIAWLLEPPAVDPRMYAYVQDNIDRFDYVLTHARALVDDQKILYYPMGGLWTEERNDVKTRDVSMIASIKALTDGQRLRNEIAAQLDGRIDLFGRNRPQQLSTKTAGLASYRFSIAIENSQLDDYFTEKIIDCAATCTVPVYWGTANIGRYLDPKGIIRFETISELETLLPTLTAERYAAMFEAVQRNQKLARQYHVAENWIFERYPFLFT